MVAPLGVEPSVPPYQGGPFNRLGRGLWCCREESNLLPMVLQTTALPLSYNSTYLVAAGRVELQMPGYEPSVSP